MIVKIIPYVFFVIFLCGPWAFYAGMIIKTPWPADQGCAEYNCSYGIDFQSNLSIAYSFFYTIANGKMMTAVDCYNRPLGCTNDIQCFSTFNGSLTPFEYQLWMLKNCAPTRHGKILYNNTRCYTGDGSADAGTVLAGTIIVCPWRDTCQNIANESAQSTFVFLAALLILLLQICLVVVCLYASENKCAYESISDSA